MALGELQLNLATLLVPMVLTTHHVKKPFGGKMCQQFCSIADCSHRFTYEDLCCHVVFNKNSSRSRRYEIIWRVRQNHSEQATLGTRKAIPSKTSPQTKLISPSSTEALERPVLSVLVAFGNKLLEVPVIHLTVRLLEARFLLRVDGDITALVYSKTFHHLILGTWKPDMMLTIKNITQTSKTETLFPNYKLFCLAIDNNRDTVFIGTDHGIEKLTLRNKKKNVMLFEHFTVKAIALDTENLTIYFASSKEIFYVEYDGIRKIHLISSSQVISLAYNEAAQVLIYLKGGKISSVLLDTVKGLPISRNVSSFLCYRDLMIYWTLTPNGRLSVLNTTSNQSNSRWFEGDIIPVLAVREQ